MRLITRSCPRSWRQRAVSLVLGLLLWSGGPLLGSLPLTPAFELPGFALHALADDDDGDDGGGGGGSPGESPGGASGPSGGGASGGGGRGGGGALVFDRARSRQNCFLFFCEPARRAQPRRVARSRAVARAPAPRSAPVVREPAPREFVLWGVTAEQVAAITAARFRVVARQALASAPGEIVRVRTAAGRVSALRRLGELAPGARLAENTRFRPFLRPAGRSEGRAPARTAGDVVTCATGITIAMVDTGVDPAHPLLKGAVLERHEVRAADRAASGVRHGTAVASLLVAAGDGPAPGLAPGVRLIAIDAFHRDASGADATDAFDLARALDVLTAGDAALVNLSLTGADNAVVALAIEGLIARGKTVVAAAGNDGPRAGPLYPAAYPGVIAVAATDAQGQPWRRSARGPHVAFAAEGVGVGLAGRNGGLEAFSGTSFAAPTVTAMLAGKLNRAGDTGAALAGLVAVAADQGEPGRDPVYGHGLVKPRDACRPVSGAK